MLLELNQFNKENPTENLKPHKRPTNFKLTLPNDWWTANSTFGSFPQEKVRKRKKNTTYNNPMRLPSNWDMSQGDYRRIIDSRLKTTYSNNKSRNEGILFTIVFIFASLAILGISDLIASFI